MLHPGTTWVQQNRTKLGKNRTTTDKTGIKKALKRTLE